CRRGKARNTFFPATRRPRKRIANSEWRIGMSLDRADHQFFSRLARLARCNVARRNLLSVDTQFSSGRDVRTHLANPSFGDVNSRQHCGRAWKGKYPVIRAIFANCPRIVEGTRNASVTCRTDRIVGRSVSCGSRRTMPNARQDDARTRSVTSTAGWRSMKVRYSLFAIRYSRGLRDD